MTDMTEGRCLVCNRFLDQFDDPTTVERAGNCLRYRAELGDDPDCIVELRRIRAAKELRSSGRRHMFIPMALTLSLVGGVVLAVQLLTWADRVAGGRLLFVFL